MVELLSGVVMVAFGAVGLTTLVRALLPLRLTESTKPWSCDLCMSWWSSLACVVVAVSLEYGTVRDAVVTLLPSFALAYAIQQRLHPIPEGGPSFDPPPPPMDQGEIEL